MKKLILVLCITFSWNVNASDAPTIRGFIALDYQATSDGEGLVLQAFELDTLEYRGDTVHITTLSRNYKPDIDISIDFVYRTAYSCTSKSMVTLLSYTENYENGSRSPYIVPEKTWNEIPANYWAAPLIIRACTLPTKEELMEWAGLRHTEILKVISPEIIGPFDTSTMGDVNWRVVEGQVEVSLNDLGFFLAEENERFPDLEY